MQINWDKCGGLAAVVVQGADGAVLMQAYADREALRLTLASGYAHYFSRTKQRVWKKGETSGNVQRVLEVRTDCDNDALLYVVEQRGAACHTGQASCFFTRILPNSNLDDGAVLNASENGADCGNSGKNGGENSAPITPNSNLAHGEYPINKSPAIPPQYDILDRLYHTALARKFGADADASGAGVGGAGANAANSYIAKLYSRGENGYLKKICEEAGEFACAVKDLRAARLGADVAAEHGSHDADVVYEAADLLFHVVVALADFDIHPERVLRELARREGTSGIAEKAARKEKN